MYKPIRDYAIIGNLRSAVLVSRDGSIDWAPAPFIDSPSIFAAILDDQKGGYWQIAPAGAYTREQYYIPDTNILVTKFTTDGGVLEVTDFLPIEKERTHLPAEKDTTFRIHRKVSCTRGSVVVRSVCAPRLNYAREITKLSEIPGGILIANGAQKGALDADVPFVIENSTAISNFALSEGGTRFFVLRYNTASALASHDDDTHHDAELAETINFWRSWTKKCDTDVCMTAGPWQDIVTRSALLLKILFFEPVGTIAAAPTTSLPESVGGVRNWDYRFTWVRDSAFTLAAFARLGHVDEAEKYFRWLIHECHTHLRKPDELQIMYGLRGERTLEEEILPHLEGYRGSHPVRIGNDAYRQSQWDIYGSVLDTAWRFHSLNRATVIDKATWEVLRSFANHVVSVWREPDEGLWEVRGGKAHFVYSKVMCWVALDRALRIADAYGFPCERETWEKERDAIRQSVMGRGWSEKKQSFVMRYGADELDASLLLIGRVGFLPPDDPHILSTITAIERELSREDGLVYRYKTNDGLPGTEGTFLLASFWLAGALAGAGRHGDSHTLFEKLLTLSNHVGLYSEEIDPLTKDFLGNFPQAYTHIGLINTALDLVDAGVDTAKPGERAIPMLTSFFRMLRK